MTCQDEAAIKEQIDYLIALAQEYRILGSLRKSETNAECLSDRKKKILEILEKARSNDWIKRISKVIFNSSIFKGDKLIQYYIPEMSSPEIFIPKQKKQQSTVIIEKIIEGKKSTDFRRMSRTQKSARILSLAYNIFTSYQYEKTTNQSNINTLIQYLNIVRTEGWLSSIPDAIFTYSPFDQNPEICKFFDGIGEDSLSIKPKPRFVIKFLNPPSSDDIAKRTVEPPISELGKLKQPLQKGEKQVFDFLNNNLPLDWEIYLQPSLNGDKPDIVLLSKLRGIVIIEVKDWDFNSSIRYSRHHNKLVAYDCTQGKEFSIPDPLQRITRYRRNVLGLLAFSDQFGRSTRSFNQKNKIDPDFCQYFVTERLIFTKASNDGTKSLFDTRAAGLKDNLPLSKVLPEVFRKPQKERFPETVYEGLKSWLIEPTAVKEQRTFISLDKRQEELALTRTKTGYRKIRGCAGSGKTLVLARKAEDLAYKGKQVLYVYYNITMGHFARDLAYRFALSVVHKRSNLFNKNTQWKHFHHILSELCQFLEVKTKDPKQIERMTPQEKSQYFRNDLPAKVLLALNALNKHKLSDVDAKEREITKKIFPNEEKHLDLPKYDAILADEVQDYDPAWIKILSCLLKEDGEFIICSDMTQDLYKTKQFWTEDILSECGFPRKWNELSACYRLPDSAIEIARNFASRYLPAMDVPLLPAQQSLDIEPCYIRWIQLREDSNRDYRDICLKEMMHIIASSYLSWSDLYIITPNSKTASELQLFLSTFGLNGLSTSGSDWKVSRENKMQFWSGDTRIKICSVQSFKGWESYGTIAIIPRDDTQAKLFAVKLYIDLTRIKRSPKGSWLTILSLNSYFKNFGQWLGSRPECSYIET